MVGMCLDDLDDADLGDLSRVNQQVASGAAHLLAAYAKEVDGGTGSHLPAQSFHQLGAIELARSLAGGDQDSHT